MSTIKSGENITRIFKLGKRYKTRDLVFIVLKNEEQHGLNGRVAFIAGKKQGNAVWRNRAKRRMRALCRDLNGPFPGFDVVFLATRRTTESDYRGMVDRAGTVLKNFLNDD